jgi:uracil-DNA glycosylase family 4
MTDTLEKLERDVVACGLCPRLVSWREGVAANPRRSFVGETYWGRPIPGFGDPDPRILVVGLAPAAHGANRTGRMFTGDRSGDFLYSALHRAGLANQAEATGADDGLALTGVRITAAVRCAPPANKPTPRERANCRGYLVREMSLCPNARVLIALGGIAWDAVLTVLGPIRPKPKFGHGTEVKVGSRTLLGSYHPSQQNTFTGRLKPYMIDDVLMRAKELAGL